MRFTITSTAETAPTPVEELPPIRRNLRGSNRSEPFTDWEGLARRIAADPEWAADVAFADWVAGRAPGA